MHVKFRHTAVPGFVSRLRRIISGLAAGDTRSNDTTTTTMSSSSSSSSSSNKETKWKHTTAKRIINTQCFSNAATGEEARLVGLPAVNIIIRPMTVDDMVEVALCEQVGYPDLARINMLEGARGLAQVSRF